MDQNERAEMTAHEERSLRNKFILFALGFVALIVIIAISIKDNDAPGNTRAAGVPSTEPVAASEPTAIPFNWAESAVSIENIKSALTGMDGFGVVSINDKSIKSIEIGDDKEAETPNNKVVYISFNPGSTWDEQQILEQVGGSLINYSEVLFTNQQVSKVMIEEYLNFTDSYGNESEEVAANIQWNREVSEKVNYENFKKMDFDAPFKIASSYHIHPAIYESIKAKLGLPANK